MADFQPDNIINLTGGGGNNQRNPTVLNTRLSELYAARATVMAVVLTNIPQVIIVAIVLFLHWNDPDVCDASYTNKWKIWSSISAIRMLAYSSAIVYIHIFKTWLEERPTALAKAHSLRNFLDAMGLVWFVVGNLWLFGDDTQYCANPEKSPIYILCYALIVISYLQICLPCILVMLFLPVLCFCMPCLIRVLARLQDLQAAKGANEAAIDALNLVTISNETLREIGNNTCPICISDMVVLFTFKLAAFPFSDELCM